MVGLCVWVANNHTTKHQHYQQTPHKKQMLTTTQPNINTANRHHTNNNNTNTTLTTPPHISSFMFKPKASKGEMPPRTFDDCRSLNECLEGYLDARGLSLAELAEVTIFWSATYAKYIEQLNEHIETHVRAKSEKARAARAEKARAEVAGHIHRIEAETAVVNAG